MSLKIKKILAIILLTSNVISAVNSDEEYMDSVINLLLNGETFEIMQSSEDVTDEQALYENGLWRCGDCDVMDERKLIYTELNTIETNDLDDVPYEVQVGIDLEGMRCVTISSQTPLQARVVSGGCAGARITLAVNAAQEFVVRVYGK